MEHSSSSMDSVAALCVCCVCCVCLAVTRREGAAARSPLTGHRLQAQELVKVLKQHRLATHVNLIPWNPVEDGDFSRPGRGAVDKFRKVLEASGIEVTVRVTRGLDAAAACGQLRNQNQAQALQEFSPLE